MRITPQFQLMADPACTVLLEDLEIIFGIDEAFWQAIKIAWRRMGRDSIGIIQPVQKHVKNVMLCTKCPRHNKYCGMAMARGYYLGLEQGKCYC